MRRFSLSWRASRDCLRVLASLLVSCSPATPVPTPPRATASSEPLLSGTPAVGSCGCRRCDTTLCSGSGDVAYAWSPDAPTLALACANTISLVSFPTLSVIARISTPATAYRLQVKGSLVLAKMPSGGVYAADLAANTISASTSRLDDTRDDPTGRVNARVSSAGNLELVEGKVVRTLGPAEVIFGFSRDGDTVFVGVAPFPPEWRIRAYSAHTGVPRRTVVGAFTVRPANTEDAAFYSSFHSNTISWLNLTTGASRVVFQSPTDNPEASYEGLAVSHDDRWLIARTGSEFSGISVVAIDVTKGEQLKYMGPPCPWKQD